MAEVILKNVSKVYESGNIAVKEVNLKINDKEFVVLVGPSGCGKSTTLRMIAGLEELTNGEIYIDNKLVNNVSPKDRDIAMVFQNYALYPHMTVYENMGFGLKLRKFSKEEIKSRVHTAANILNLEEYLNRKPKALSGGQRQRVALGRAIVRNPKVFLFDEPLSNLDAKLRVQMRTEISKLHHQLGATMIYVTHDQSEAMTMGDRIVVMKNGEVKQVETPLNIYNKPFDKFVAGFIGSPSMNFIDGMIIKENELVFLSKEGLKIKLQDKTNIISTYLNKEVIIGIRPEDIYDNKFEDRNLHKINVKLEVVEPMGNEIFIYFILSGSQIVARIPAREKPEVEKIISLYLDIDKIHFFDKETEYRI
jgi:multiple sugar transport system ATP-binding protein